MGGIGNGHGAIPFDDDMIVSKPTIVFHSSQIFFNFLAMACFASVASFQAKWNVGPSGLTGFALFISVSGILLSTFMLMVPVIYEKYDKFTRLARTLKEVRVGFILTGVGVGVSLLIAFIVTISAWTQAGCKNPDNDPNQGKGDDFKTGLANFCNTKKAGGVFFWFSFGFWTASLVLLVLDWRSGKLHVPPRDPPFTHPPTEHGGSDDDHYDDEESSYQHIPPGRRPTTDNSNSPSSPFADSNRYSSNVPSGSFSTPSAAFSSPAPSRPSMDAYGAFSDPAPSGFGSSPTNLPKTRPSVDAYGAFSDSAPSDFESSPSRIPDVDLGPRISRTMQYADPYAAVRSSVGGVSSTKPPTYESYQGYR